MQGRVRNYLKNFLLPAVVGGAATGVLTAAVVCAYKWCALHVISYSQMGYAFLRANPVWLPLVLVVLAALAFGFSWLYQKAPDLKGGGIPSAIGVLRGLITFRWLRSLIGTFVLSTLSFAIGVPLGNEGPSVLMGTAVGKGTVGIGGRHHAWERYTMTGGACAGFAVATGAPLSGVMFAVEEAHERVSPMIIIVAVVTVCFAMIATHLLSPLLGVPVLLFPTLKIGALSVKYAWLPLVMGLAVGLFSVGFLRLYRLFRKAFHRAAGKVPRAVVLFAIFAVTLGLGIYSYSAISTGHALTQKLFGASATVYLLLILLVVRTALTLGANTAGVTGGIFLPLIAIGAVFSALCGEGLTALGVPEELYATIVAIGITSCIAGMMNMPLTAIVFSVEALGLGGNVLFSALAAVTAFIVVEAFRVRSINEKVLDGRVEAQNHGKRRTVVDTCVTVQPKSFADGKRVKDVFWPADFLVLSVTDEGGQWKTGGLSAGDVLHVRYGTYDEQKTAAQIEEIVGKQ